MRELKNFVICRNSRYKSEELKLFYSAAATLISSFYFQQCTAIAYINLFDLIHYLTMQLKQFQLQVICVLLTALFVYICYKSTGRNRHC
jgi:hypothetical protein